MDADHERSFRIRHYECDPYGHLNNTSYLRYLEEVEIDAGVVDHAWAARRVEITYVRPPAFGDTVRVAAGAAGAGDGWVSRRYEFTSNGAAVAEACVSWAAAGAAPQADGACPEAIPSAPPAPDVVFRQHRTVGWRDIGAGGRVGPATLAAFAEDAGIAILASFGWPMDRCTEEGFAMVLRRHRVEYGRVVGLGADVGVATYASDRRRASAIRHYFITADEVPVARFRSLYAWVDPGFMRPIRIPDGFVADFAGNFA